MGIIEAASGETNNEKPEVIETPDDGSAGTTDANIIEPPVAPTQKSYRYTILLDNGHAASTPGKRSPKEDGMEQFFEYEFNRDIVKRIARKLDKLGIRYEILVPEISTDVPLSIRAERANEACKKYGTENCLFLSIHSNAAGKGDRWMIAKGWCCYTSKGETVSDPYAETFMREAEKILVPLGRTIRKYSQKKYSWEDNLTVLVKTKCPAILTENLFYDNKDEVKFLQSEEGREAIAQIHVNAILKIENPDG
jgi:N-acetylmuramoyl-L-alanine amidase